MNRSDVFPQRFRIEIPKSPWVVVGPRGVFWLGEAENELAAWTIAFGWPDDEEIAKAKAHGYYAAEATITWKKPE